MHPLQLVCTATSAILLTVQVIDIPGKVQWTTFTADPSSTSSSVVVINGKDKNNEYKTSLIYIENKEGYKIEKVTLWGAEFCKYPAKVFLHGRSSQIPPVDGHYVDECIINNSPLNEKSTYPNGKKIKVYYDQGKKAIQYDVENVNIEAYSCPDISALFSADEVIDISQGVDWAVFAGDSSSPSSSLAVLKAKDDNGEEKTSIIYMDEKQGKKIKETYLCGFARYCEYPAEVYLVTTDGSVDPVVGHFVDNCTIKDTPIREITYASYPNGETIKVFYNDGKKKAIQYKVQNVYVEHLDLLWQYLG